MDTVITSASESAGTTETATPEQTTGIGNVDPNTGETGSSEGGSSQERTEGGQPQGRERRKWSIQDEVKELRAQRRELREQLSSLGTVREELAALREEMNRRNNPGTAKTPANFWQDPEGTLDAKLEEKLERLQNTMLERFQTTREQEYRNQAIRQERASAAEFIRSQQGYHPDDDDDLAEIIEGIPNREHLSPQWVAEYAWMKLQQQRGISDRSSLKRQASTVHGQPPGVGFGRKNWAKAEFEQALDMIEKDPTNPKHAELIKELEAAHKEGRVK